MKRPDPKEYESMKIYLYHRHLEQYTTHIEEQNKALLEACVWATAFGINGDVHDKIILNKLNEAIKSTS